jgi:hypothetical protein
VPTFYPEVKKQEDDEVEVGRAKIHESVFRRIENHAQAYAPIGLPPCYDVVKDDGEIISPDKFSIANATSPLESSAAAEQRALAQEHVWNWVWARRIAYFATVGATLWLVSFPLVSSAQRADEFYSRLRWVSDLVRFLGGFLPKFASTWIDGYARAPFWFAAMVLLLVVLLSASTWIASRTSNLMSSIWRKTPAAPLGLPNDPIYKLRSSKAYIGFHNGLKHTVAPAFFAAVFLYLGLSVASHISFNVFDVWGNTCVEHAAIHPATKLNVDDVRVIDFDISNLCTPTGVELETNGARYLVQVVPPRGVEPKNWTWHNGIFKVPVGGPSTKEPVSWYERLYLTMFIPLRRELFEDWFRIVLRYGPVGGEESTFEPDPTDPIIQDNIKPTRTGELFIFVNNAVIGVPGFYGYLYKFSDGKGRLTVKRTK